MYTGEVVICTRWAKRRRCVAVWKVKAVEAQLLSSHEALPGESVPDRFAVSAMRGQLDMERSSREHLQASALHVLEKAARLDSWDADRAEVPD
eukprot:4953806-Amphidinium_carterae.1